MRLLALAALIAPLTGSTDAGLEAWADACASSRYSCELLARPAVVRAYLVDRYGQYAAGDRYIVIDPRVTDPKLLHAVMAHEMVHYLQWRYGVWKPTRESGCFIEHEAFAVSNKILERTGAVNLMVRWNDVAGYYGCPKDTEEVPDGEPGVQGHGASAD